MSEMEEQVARGICKSQMERWGYAETVPDYVERLWKECLPDARAAIAAMYEPTAEMLRAAAPFPMLLVLEKNDAEYTKSMEAATLADRLAARSMYQRMMDEALK